MRSQLILTVDIRIVVRELLRVDAFRIPRLLCTADYNLPAEGLGR
jgi:hypothetical protein